MLTPIELQTWLWVETGENISHCWESKAGGPSHQELIRRFRLPRRCRSSCGDFRLATGTLRPAADYLRRARSDWHLNRKLIMTRAYVTLIRLLPASGSDTDSADCSGSVPRNLAHFFNVVFNNTHSLLRNAQRSSKPRHACWQLATSLSAPSHAGCRTNLPFLCGLFGLAWCDVPGKKPANWFIFWIG